MASPTVSGTADAGSNVELFSENNSIGSTTADEQGNWTLKPTTALGVGNYSITATSSVSNSLTSQVSNTLSLEIDFAGSAEQDRNIGYY